MQKEHKLRMTPSVYYVWVGGSCDYGHEERCSGGAYIIQKDEQVVENYSISDDHTTEFRMILAVMIELRSSSLTTRQSTKPDGFVFALAAPSVHAMEVIPEDSDIVFLTNVSYIQQNFDRQPTDKTINADLILKCIEMKGKHSSVTVKVIPFHKYPQLPETHAMAHDAMICLRNELAH